MPTLASNRVTTMPGEVHIGWVMYEYIRTASTHVQPVCAVAGQDVRQTGRDTATGDDPAAGRDRALVPLELLERLRVVRPEVDEVDAGGDRSVGDRDVVAHVGRVEDDIGAGEGGRQRRGVIHIDARRPASSAPSRRRSAAAASGRMSPTVTS